MLIGKDTDTLLGAANAHCATMHSLGLDASATNRILFAYLESHDTDPTDMRRFTAWCLKARARYPSLNVAALPMAGHLVPSGESEAVRSLMYGSLVRFEELVIARDPASTIHPLVLGQETSLTPEGRPREVAPPLITTELVDPLLCALTAVRDEFCDSLENPSGRLNVSLGLMSPYILNTVLPLVEPFADTEVLHMSPHYLRMAMVGDEVAESVLQNSADMWLIMSSRAWLDSGRDQVHGF